MVRRLEHLLNMKLISSALAVSKAGSSVSFSHPLTNQLILTTLPVLNSGRLSREEHPSNIPNMEVAAPVSHLGIPVRLRQPWKAF